MTGTSPAERADLGEALEATNRDLEPHGLYISHIWGPEQQILSPAWRKACRPIAFAAQHLRLSTLGPVDLILSKLCRADEPDLADIRHVIVHERLAAAELRIAMREALVPEVFREVYPASCAKVDELLALLSP